MVQIGAEYEILVRNASGITTSRRAGESDSFVKNFTLLIEAGLRNTAASVKDTTGATKSCHGFTCTVGDTEVNIDSRHIVVGTGTDPVGIDDYTLDGKIAKTTLWHSMALITPEAPYIDGGYIKARVAKRSFINRTTSPVTISEMGIVVLSSGSNILILRDVLPEAIVVPVGGGVDIAYTFKTAISGTGDSFLQNYLRAIVCSFNGSALVSVPDTDGTTRSINFAGTFPANAVAGVDYYGILVGTSGDSTIGDENVLGAPIPHGGVDGSLNHSDVFFTPTETDDTGAELALHRSFVNMSPDPITVREVGVVARHSGYNVLLLRDVVDPMEIPAGGGVNVTVVLRTEL